MHTPHLLSALLALSIVCTPVAHAQSLPDGGDATGSPLDCRGTNRTLPTVVRGAGSEIRIQSQSETGLAEQSRVETGNRLYNGLALAPGQLGLTLAYFTPSTATGATLFSSTGGSISSARTPAIQNVFLPLCAFALTSDLDGFDNRLNALETTGGTRLANVEIAVGELARVAAIQGVLDIAMPTGDKTNRLGLTVNEGYREEAIGLSYVRVQGPIDIGVAVGYSGGQSAGKASVGFSW